MSLHAVTASITLLTAIPGSGKTLRMIQMMAAHLADGDLVYASNIDGLCLPGVIPFDDPREWQQLPAGSVLFVDEAQKFFRARRSGEPPAFIAAMEEIRHDSVRLVLATQQPNYLDTHLRGLVGRHEHLVRKGGANKSTIYRADGVMDNVRQLAGKKGLDKFDWSFPTEHYKHYKSAEVHTVGRQMPARLKAVLGLFGIAALLIVGVVMMIGSDVSEASPKPAAASANDAPLGAVSRSLSLGQGEDAPVTPEQYLAQLVPRVPEMPYSAPIYDGRQARAEPRIMCMTSGAGLNGLGAYADSSCTCLTEQGTLYAIDDRKCRDLAVSGPPYNPFKEPERDLRPRDATQRGDDAREPSPTAVIVDAPQIAAYGDIGVGQ